MNTDIETLDAYAEMLSAAAMEVQNISDAIKVKTEKSVKRIVGNPKKRAETGGKQ